MSDQRRMNIKNELEALLYDCKKVSDEQATRMCLEKMKNIIRASCIPYMRLHFDK